MRCLALLPAAVAVLCLATAGSAAAADYTLTLKDHRFEPDTLHIPAGQRVKVTIHNTDPTEEEFDSYELHREQVIRGNGTAVVYLGPLKPGIYAFMGEGHPLTATGQVVVDAEPGAK